MCAGPREVRNLSQHGLQQVQLLKRPTVACRKGMGVGVQRGGPFSVQAPIGSWLQTDGQQQQ